MKQVGEPDAGNPQVRFDERECGNGAWSRYCDTRRRKGEPTGKTNFDLNHRATSRLFYEGLLLVKFARVLISFQSRGSHSSIRASGQAPCPSGLFRDHEGCPIYQRADWPKSRTSSPPQHGMRLIRIPSFQESFVFGSVFLSLLLRREIRVLNLMEQPAHPAVRDGRGHHAAGLAFATQAGCHLLPPGFVSG